MARTFIRRLAVMWAVMVVATMWVTSASAGNIPISSCGTLTSSGNTYVLTADVSSGGICFTVAANNITLDLNGHSITAGLAGVSDYDVARLNTTVKNSAAGSGVPQADGQITATGIGIALFASSHNQVLGVEVAGNNIVAIGVGNHSLVKNCRVEGTAQAAIAADHDSQVQGCVVVLTGGDGIDGTDNMLITQNTVQSGVGGLTGISVGDFSTVTSNTVTSDRVGISTGSHATVNYNTANNNGDTGIETGGFSGVAHNTANNNAGGGIRVGLGSTDTTNNTVTFNTTNTNAGIGLEVQCPSGVANNVSQGNGTNYQFDGTGCVTSNNK